jgi:ATP-binding cassette subfamily D (ALD) protein 3
VDDSSSVRKQARLDNFDMAPALSTMQPSRVLGVAGLAMTFYIIYMKKKVHQLNLADSKDSKSSARGTPMVERNHRVGVDRRFMEQIKKILPICIPGMASREAILLGTLTAVLIARTWLDIWFSGFNGSVVRAIVSRDRKVSGSSYAIIL